MQLVLPPVIIIKLKLEDQIFTFLTLKLPAGGTPYFVIRLRNSSLSQFVQKLHLQAFKQNVERKLVVEN